MTLSLILAQERQLMGGLRSRIACHDCGYLIPRYVGEAINHAKYTIVQKAVFVSCPTPAATDVHAVRCGRLGYGKGKGALYFETNTMRVTIR